MSATKQDRSQAESGDDATHAGNADARNLPAQQCSHELQVTVKIHSHDDEPYLFGDTPDEDSDFSEPLFRDLGGCRRWSKQINAFANLCEETTFLAFELFDRCGRLNREYCDHVIRKGSGIWGKELDHGDILLFENMNIEPFGVAREDFFAFASPMHLTRGLNRNDETLEPRTVYEQSESFKHFFRSLGFRRVGTSEWLAFADDDDHPSRRLDKAQDWDNPERSKEEHLAPESLRTVLSSLSDSSTSGAECVCQMEKVFAVEENMPLWVYINEMGNTILHVAAISRKADPIPYIMSKAPDLAGKRNADGYTPSEALQSSLEVQRTRRPRGWGRAAMDVMSDSFEGFCQSDIACLAALTGTEIVDLTKLSDRDIWVVSKATDETASRVPEVIPIRNALRLKYGCTCGQCIGGFLSPRTRFALQYQAQFQYDNLDELHSGGSSGLDWVELNGHILSHLTEGVRENLKTNKSMRQGFINMCDHIARCLGRKRLPDATTVLDFYQNQVREWPPVTGNYLERGGTVAAVAMMIFDMVIDQDEWAGDGTIMDVFEDDLNQLPTCRNDHEFDFVSSMCGYERIPTEDFAEFYRRVKE
ncbi:hypothetical protein GGR58DRAFT_518699 [Xylaria digitata]|nr:hypothetical protein GGR58DRAFT_518699 [Xylaria digitata]